TNCRHRLHLWWRGTMVTVTGSAARGRKIPSSLQCFPMHALPIIFKLRGRNFVFRHVSCVCVTSRAGLRKVQGMDWRAGVLDFSDVMHTVAIDAGGSRGIAGGDAHSVNTRLVLVELVDSLLRPELVYQARIAMAAGT